MNKKKIAVGLIFVVLLVASNLIGGFIGFGKGYEAKMFHEGMDVIPTITMLEKLRDGKTDFPIQMLETKLDWQIYNLDSTKESIDSIYNPNKYWDHRDHHDLANKMMKYAIKYRTKIPSSFDNQAFRETIKGILDRYDKTQK